MQNVFPKFSKTKATVRSPGPELGANNDEIYKGLLGMSDVDISSYKDKGLI
jgi:formyl-CoA transferase